MTLTLTLLISNAMAPTFVPSVNFVYINRRDNSAYSKHLPIVIHSFSASSRPKNNQHRAFTKTEQLQHQTLYDGSLISNWQKLHRDYDCQQRVL
jgi:hypothetical protein